MATQNIDNHINYTDNWEGMTGAQVEDAISRALDDDKNNRIVGGEYSNPYLTLKKGDGSNLDPIEITVMTPDYEYGIYVYALRVDGTVYKGGLTERTIQYNKDKKFELGIAVYATATTTYTAQRNTSLTINVTYGNKKTQIHAATISSEYFVLNDERAVSSLSVPEGQTIDSLVKWIDVSELFSSTYSAGSIVATIVPDQEAKNSILTYTFSTPITIQVISLSYSGNYYTSGSQVTFTLNGGNSNNYILEGFNGEAALTTSDISGMTVALNPGLNRLMVRAKFATDSSIYTDCCFLDIISTLNYDGTAVAINKVSDAIENNSIATLYQLTVYSSEKDSTTVTTYLSEIDPSGTPNPTVSEMLKTQVISKEDYEDNNIFETTYYKYIESLNNKEASRYLIVKVNDEFYQFVTEEEGDDFSAYSAAYKVMKLSAVTEEYCYYRTGTTYNFDQINGRNNNVFVTKDYAESVGVDANIPDNIEITDGWKEDSGVLYFKISAQDQPIVTLSNLNLGEEFTFETKFKTYNISDTTKPILTFGSMRLLPTQFAFLGDTDKRNSIFRKETIIHLLVTVKKNFTIPTTDPLYPDYMTEGNTYEGSFQQKFDQAMSSSTNSASKYNLVRIFINGCIDREYILSDSEFADLQKSSIIINPTTSDVNFYLLRLYNQTALDFTQVQQNYISSLSNDVSNSSDKPKKAFYDKNDILNDNGTISFTKSYKKYNTIVMVFPKDPKNPNRTNYVPSRAWGGKDNADPHPNDNLPVTMFIGYNDESKNKKYGGRLTNTRVRGQGTSAMRYWIWNVATHLSKAKKYVANEDGTPNTNSTEKAKSRFTPYSNLDTDTNKFTGKENVLKKCYLMPDDDDTEVVKAVGKVNYASSMQNHKIGATNLYNAFYQSRVSNFKVGDTELGGKKAVKEEPFLYFYTYADDWDVSNWELADVLAADITDDSGKSKVKFMGFLTWGSGKGDEQTFAIDSDRTPGYLFLEGGENGDKAVQFRVPWQALQRNNVSWTDYNDETHVAVALQDVPQISYEDSLERPWDHLLISGDESIIYNPTTADVTGAWDVNTGLEELDSGEFRLDVGSDDAPNKYLRQSIKTWREFYDFVYTHDWDIEFTSDSDCANWSKSKKVCCTAATCNVPINNGTHSAKDVYRYNSLAEKWVRAGVKFDTTAQEWEAYNLQTVTGKSSNEAALAYLRKDFKENIGYLKSDAANTGPLDTKDASIHQALIRLLAGTDNRAKNTYFRVVGPIMNSSQKVVDGVPQVDEDGEPVLEWSEPEDYATNPRKYHFVGFLQDDVDTILATDNNGLQTKSYNLLEPSYYNENDTDEASKMSQWGENGRNVFFRCFDQAYESEIITELGELIDFAFANSKDVSLTSTEFYQDFFEMQNSMYPAVAYNQTAKIYYELGQFVLNTKAISDFGSNDEQPIEQSHGSCIESEMSFMDKRLRFLGSQSLKYSNESNKMELNPGAGSGQGSALIQLEMEYSIGQDLYPNYKTTGWAYFHTNKDSASDFIATSYKSYEDSISRYRLLKEGEVGVHTFDMQDSVNNIINQVDLYKTLKLRGYQNSSLKASYSSLLEITIDNNDRGDFPESAFTDSGWVPDFPVAQKITFANMQLPDTLDFSNSVKLQTLNLSGSTINRVILPKSSHLKEIILPATIQRLEIYNDPNLKTVTLEGLDKLNTIDINCNKVGSFDLSQFCDDIIGSPLEGTITLSDADMTISAEAMDNLVLHNAKITGHINLDETISYELKKQLMQVYGNIDDSSNSLYITYNKQTIETITCEENITIYGKGTHSNPFKVNISEGNDMKFKQNAEGVWVPDITYTWVTNPGAKVATLSSNGDIEMLVDSSTSTGKVKITVNTENQTFNNLYTTISFIWKAPAIGDFMYYDGSYSSSYNQNKTMVGLVYAVDSTDDTSGTAYIIGKEYMTDTALYLGYSNEGKSTSSATLLSDMYYIGTILQNWNLITSVGEMNSSDYTAMTGVSSTKPSDDIYVGNYSDFTTENFTGKEDTQIYVDTINDRILPLLYRNYASQVRNYITYTGNQEYYISNMNNLLSLCSKLSLSSSTKTSEISSCVLFPYFYAAHVYEPVIESTETLDDQFKSGNWYIPSATQLGRVIYYRGYSAKGSEFTKPEGVEDAVSTSIKAGKTDSTKPIFSTARSSMPIFPTAWENLAKSQNMSTSMASSTQAEYSYQKVYKSWNTSGDFNYKWYTGKYYDTSTYYSGDMDALKAAWKLTKHQGIPFTQYNYKKS